MTDMITSFEKLLNPMTPEAFFAEVHYRQPIHIPASWAEKFSSVMSWDILNEMLAMDVWDGSTLQLVIDRQRVPPASYSRHVLNRNQRQVMQPDSAKVMELIRQGASLVLNNIETLHPGCLAVAETIGAGLGAKVSANLYCSWQQHQAFDSHYDRHDVFALHVVGEKRWRVYEGRLENPIEHPAFYNIPQAECDRLKGQIAAELTMRSGDLLYLPRGQFHDALASSEASIHVTFGCNEPTGLDWLTFFWERAVQDSGFREYLPRSGGPAGGPGGDEALKAHLAKLVERLKDMAMEPQSLAASKAFRQGFSVPRSTYDLPGPLPKMKRDS